MFSYRLIIQKALNIAWQHKYLWLFGLFATIVAASGSFEYQFLSGNLQAGSLENPYFYLNLVLIGLESLGLFLLGILNLFTYNILTIINTLTVIIMVTALIASFVWLSISSQGALFSASKELIINGKKKVALNLQKLITTGHNNFWPVLGLNLIAKLAIIIILSLISLPLIILATKTSISLTFIYTLAFIILAPLAIACTIIVRYAIAFKVLDAEDFVGSIKKSWLLFKNNWLVSVEMGLILFLINFAVGFLLVIGLSILVLPYFIFAIDYGIVLLIIILALIALFLILSLGAFITTFQISAWTNIFLELKKGNGQAKLERIFARK